MLWALVNLVWLFGVPFLFGLWLQHEVELQYAAGSRISTDGDSISLPVGGVFIFNGLLLVAANAAWGLWSFVRSRRAP
jgi:hypothetical protein